MKGNSIMNIDKIILNIKYKYKELCEVLEEEEKGRGDSRSAQFDKWSRYFDFYKPNPKGHFLIVTKIHSNVKPKVDGRINNGKHPNSKLSNSIYAPYIDKLLLDSLKNKESIAYITMTDIAETVGLVNSTYRNTLQVRSDFRKYLAEREDITNNSAFRNIYYSIRNIMRPAILGSVDRLKREGYIKYKYGYVITEGTITRIANLEEDKQIKLIEQDILVEFDVASKNKLGNRMSSYYARVNEEVKKVYPDIIYIYQGFEIIQTDNIDRDNRLEPKDIKQAKQELNNIVINKMMEKLHRDYAKIEDKYNAIVDELIYGEDNSTKLVFEHWEKEILEDDYISNAKKILDIIIDISARRLNIGDIIE